MNILKNYQKHTTKFKINNIYLDVHNDILFGLIRKILKTLNFDKEINNVFSKSCVFNGVDVLIPCYKHSNFIIETVKSCLNQSVEPNNIIVLLMDDESKKLKQNLVELDSSIICIDSDRKFPSEARNYLFTFSKSSHIIFLDADDKFEDFYIIENLCSFYLYDIVMPEWEDCINPNIYNVLFNSQTTSLIKREYFENNKFDENLINGCEDTEFFLRSFLNGASIKYSTAKFKKSFNNCASYTTFEKYGSYDLLYKHRKTFLPILKEIYKKEFNTIDLSRIYYLMQLLNLNLDYIKNICELENYNNFDSIILARTTPAASLIRSKYSKISTDLDKFVQLNKNVNEFFSKKYIEKIKEVTYDKPTLNSISVVIPCYMQSEYVKDSILSILNQTKQSFVKEILVLLMDKKSQELKDKLEKLDNRITCFINQRLWLPSARNFLIKKSTGKYIIPLDADDKLDKEFINETIYYIDKNDIVLVDIKREDGTVSTTNFEHTSTYNIFDFPHTHPTCLINRNFIKKFNDEIYDEIFNTGFEDHDFWFKSALYGKIKYIRKPLIVYRSNNNRSEKDVSYLSLAKVNFNNLEMLIKYKDIYKDFIILCTLSENKEIKELSKVLLEAIDYFNIDVERIKELQKLC